LFIHPQLTALHLLGVPITVPLRVYQITASPIVNLRRADPTHTRALSSTSHNAVLDNLEIEQKQFVMLRRYRDLPEAVVVKSILDFDGIECFFTDEDLIRMDWFWSGSLGGVKLWVRQQDVNEAQNLIDPTPTRGIPRSSVHFSFFGLPIPLKRRGWKCHSCGHSWRQF
jgi:hypothetical protein